MRTSAFFAFACVLLSVSGTAQEALPDALDGATTFTPIDAIVAVVGDGIVLESEVEAQAFAMKAQMAQMGKSADLTDAQRCNLLEELCCSKNSSCTTPNWTACGGLRRRRSWMKSTADLAYYVQMFGSVEAFEAEYGQSVSEWKAEFEDPVREQLLAGRMQAAINQQVRATPGEVQLLFAETPADSLPLIPEACALPRTRAATRHHRGTKSGGAKLPRQRANGGGYRQAES